MSKRRDPKEASRHVSRRTRDMRRERPDSVGVTVLGRQGDRWRVRRDHWPFDILVPSSPINADIPAPCRMDLSYENGNPHAPFLLWLVGGEKARRRRIGPGAEEIDYVWPCSASNSGRNWLGGSEVITWEDDTWHGTPARVASGSSDFHQCLAVGDGLWLMDLVRDEDDNYEQRLRQYAIALTPDGDGGWQPIDTHTVSKAFDYDPRADYYTYATLEAVDPSVVYVIQRRRMEFGSWFLWSLHAFSSGGLTESWKVEMDDPDGLIEPSAVFPTSEGLVVGCMQREFVSVGVGYRYHAHLLLFPGGSDVYTDHELDPPGLPGYLADIYLSATGPSVLDAYMVSHARGDRGVELPA